jgi:hypothetical protein|tara:strand:- start:14 stop:469 length:456 start_codon:yes stop_codon:yes gene_type:complete
MKVFKKIGLFLLIVFVCIQFIPTNRNQSTEILDTDITKTFKVPQNIQTLLNESCYDCHSNNTKYPWYNKIQPVSFLLERDINQGKKELNFSELGGYSNRRQKSKLKSLISQVKDDKMPIASYGLMHSNAKLSESEKKEIIDWATTLRDNLK